MNALTNEDVSLIEQLIGCISMKQIADKFECTVSEIKQTMKLKSGKVSKADKVRKLHAEGRSRGDCAAIVGCSKNLVCYALGAKDAPPVISAGMRFSKLTVTGNAEPTKSRIKRYQCLCDCGKRHVARHDLLMSGKVRSCGCFKGEFRVMALNLVSRSKRVFSGARGRPLKADYAAIRECHRLISADGLSVAMAAKKAGINISAYYRHRDYALQNKR
jgi:hypothetical protein